MNVGFALDGPNKLGAENFETAIKFAVNVTNYLDVDANKTWIYLVYGQYKRVFKTRSELLSFTPENEHSPDATNLRLGETLRTVREQLLHGASRREAVTTVFVIASDKSGDDIAEPAVLLKKGNATMFALGVGKNYSEGQLKEVASDPNNEHLITLSAWNAVNKDLAERVARKLCQGKLK